MSEDLESSHRVVEQNGKFEVVSPTQRVILSCGDSASAQHYATLFNKAYELGYKAGYKDCRKQE
jgi:hypothetical protein